MMSDNKKNNNIMSVVIISYNNLQYIKECLDSLFSQSYPSIELIIADDGSENFDMIMLRDYIEKNKSDNIKFIQIFTNSENLGTVKNINKALKKVCGEYVKILAADDLFYQDDAILKCVNYFESHNCIMAISEIVKLYPDSKEKKSNQKKYSELLKNKNIKKTLGVAITGSLIKAPSVFFKKEFFKKYGLFDESYKLIEDLPMWLKVLKAGESIGFIDEILVKYRVSVGVTNSHNEKNKLFLRDQKRLYQNELLPLGREVNPYKSRVCRYYYKKNFIYDDCKFMKKIIFNIKYMDVLLFRFIRHVWRYV